MIYDCDLKITNLRYDIENKGLMIHATDGEKYYEICAPIELNVDIKLTSTLESIYCGGCCIQDRLSKSHDLEIKFTNKYPIYNDKALTITELPPVELTVKDLEREKHRKVKIISE